MNCKSTNSFLIVKLTKLVLLTQNSAYAYEESFPTENSAYAYEESFPTENSAYAYEVSFALAKLLGGTTHVSQKNHSLP
jgi:hypothetical protein